MQPFALQNYTLQYPYAVRERISVLTLCVLVVFVPAVIIALYTMVIDGLFSHQPPSATTGKRRMLTGRYRMKDRLWELNCGILGLALSVGAAFTITGRLIPCETIGSAMLKVCRGAEECNRQTEARFDIKV